MRFIKSTVTFVVIYSILLLGSLFINQQLSLHPEVAINIAITVIAALAVNKINSVKSYAQTELFGLSAIGGLCAVIAIFTLAYFNVNFEQPNLLESCISFSFNALAVYLTLYLSSIKHKKTC